MRPKNLTSFLTALACWCLGCGLSFARPTGPAARHPALHITASTSAKRPHTPQKVSGSRSKRLTVPSSKAANSRPSAHHGPQAAPRLLKATTNPQVHKSATPPPALPTQAAMDRVHSWEAQRAMAASAAIAAADRAADPGVQGNPSRTPAPAIRAVRSPIAGDLSAVPPGDAPTRIQEPAARNAPKSEVAASSNTGQAWKRSQLKPAGEEASLSEYLPSFDEGRDHLTLPPPLYGSHEILLHQNEVADHDGLMRVRDDADLANLRRQKKLVALPSGQALRIDVRLPANRRFARPWTADFLAQLARDHFARFQTPVQVNSAVRTVQFQRRLERTNGNAAPSTGETASPHLTGQAIDIGKGSLTLPEIAWMRSYLQPLIARGKIDVEEEFQQACFHISVYKTYSPAGAKTSATAEQRFSVSNSQHPAPTD